MIKSFNGKMPKIADSAFISETAYVVGDVEIGENSSVWPGAVVRGDLGSIKIGRNTVIQDNCVIHSGSFSSGMDDVTIGDRVTFGHGAVSHGHSIGNNVLIGINATILHDAEIGDFCIVGANCLVGQGMKVPARSFVAGAPGKIKGGPSPEQLQWIEGMPQAYTKLAKQYKEQGL